MSIFTKDEAWDEKEKEATPVVGETTRGPVIPLVSREQAEKIFSSQRRMSLEEGWAQVDKCLGRQSDSK